MSRGALLILILISAATSCSSTTERVKVTRREPAHVDLGASRRIGVLAFAGPGGVRLARLVVSGLGREEPQLEGVWAGATPAGDGLLARMKQRRLDAVLAGAVELLEGPDEREDPKQAGPTWSPRPARVRIRFHVLRADGGRTTAPPVSIAVSREELRRLERTAGWRELLLQRAAHQIVRGLRPRSVPDEVTWERAGSYDVEARRLFAKRDYAGARRSLDKALQTAKESGAGPVTLGALYFDRAVCLDLLGQSAAAERSYDEALTLNGSELHIRTLQAFRARRRRRARGGR